ncbi:MAG: hypothetical protein AB7O91_10635 [Sphingomonas sp.]
MRTKPALLLGICLAAAAPAQEPWRPSIGYPSLPPFAASANAFAPHGWTVETQARGDLNGDGAADLVFVLLAPDMPGAPRRSSRYDSDASAYANPRILGIALARRAGGYRLVLNNHSFLPPKWAPNGASQGWMLFEDGSVDASAGRLRIEFQYTRAHQTYTFRWQDGALRLIGFDSGGVTGGCMNYLSINFLTHRARMEAGWVDRDGGPTGWRRLAPRPLLTIDQIGDGQEFDPHRLVSRFPLRCPNRT